MVGVRPNSPAQMTTVRQQGVGGPSNRGSGSERTPGRGEWRLACDAPGDCSRVRVPARQRHHRPQRTPTSISRRASPGILVPKWGVAAIANPAIEPTRDSHRMPAIVLRTSSRGQRFIGFTRGAASPPLANAPADAPQTPGFHYIEITRSRCASRSGVTRDDTSGTRSRYGSASREGVKGIAQESAAAGPLTGQDRNVPGDIGPANGKLMGTDRSNRGMNHRRVRPMPRLHGIRVPALAVSPSRLMTERIDGERIHLFRQERIALSTKLNAAHRGVDRSGVAETMVVPGMRVERLELQLGPPAEPRGV